MTARTLVADSIDEQRCKSMMKGIEQETIVIWHDIE